MQQKQSIVMPDLTSCAAFDSGCSASGIVFLPQIIPALFGSIHQGNSEILYSHKLILFFPFH